MRSEESHDGLDQRAYDAECSNHRVGRFVGIKVSVVGEESDFDADDDECSDGHTHCGGHESLMEPEPEVFAARLDVLPCLFVVTSHNLKIIRVIKENGNCQKDLDSYHSG